jgi:hypothetical protein
VVRSIQESSFSTLQQLAFTRGDSKTNACFFRIKVNIPEQALAKDLRFVRNFGYGRTERHQAAQPRNPDAQMVCLSSRNATIGLLRCLKACTLYPSTRRASLWDSLRSHLSYCFVPWYIVRMTNADICRA